LRISYDILRIRCMLHITYHHFMLHIAYAVFILLTEIFSLYYCMCHYIIIYITMYITSNVYSKVTITTYTITTYTSDRDGKGRVGE
jgi:hypothetical protein